MDGNVVCFADSLGREWFPKVTVRCLVNFERLTGVNLLEPMFSAGKENDGKIMLNFLKIENMMVLAYESCKVSDGSKYKVVDKRTMKEVDFEDFCEAVDLEKLPSIIQAVMESTMKTMPKQKDMSGSEVPDKAHPFERGR